MGRYRCEWVDPDTGERCPEVFTTGTARATHAKSHRKRRCRYCGELFSENGHTQHEMRCTARPTAFSCDTFTERIEDFLGHCHEVPSGQVLVVSITAGPFFMPPSQAARMAAVSDESLVMIPAELLDAPEEAARWRRRPRTTQAEQELSDERQPTPRSAGSPGHHDLPGFGPRVL